MATLLFYQEQLSLQEVAAILGISVAAVKGRLHKFRLEIKARLLPLYAEINHAVSTKLKRNIMIKVTIADVLREEHNGTQVYVVVLWDEASRRILPIWVGKWEGESIALGLREHSTPRPLTFNFMANLLKAVGAQLEEVRIETVSEGTFFAVAKLRSGDLVREVDARPSDAIALALHLNSPIYATQEVLEQLGMDVSAALEDRQLGKGVDELMREKEEQWIRQKQEVASKSPPTKEELQSAYQKLITRVFGSESD